MNAIIRGFRRLFIAGLLLGCGAIHAQDNAAQINTQQDVAHGGFEDRLERETTSAWPIRILERSIS